MDKIDLNAICNKILWELPIAKEGEVEIAIREYAIKCAKEAIHQALVLTSKELVINIDVLKAQSFEGWSPGEEAGYITAATTIQKWEELLPSHIEKLIV